MLKGLPVARHDVHRDHKPSSPDNKRVLVVDPATMNYGQELFGERIVTFRKMATSIMS